MSEIIEPDEYHEPNIEKLYLGLGCFATGAFIDTMTRLQETLSVKIGIGLAATGTLIFAHEVYKTLLTNNEPDGDNN